MRSKAVYQERITCAYKLQMVIKDLPFCVMPMGGVCLLDPYRKTGLCVGLPVAGLEELPCRLYMHALPCECSIYSLKVVHQWRIPSLHGCWQQCLWHAWHWCYDFAT